MGRNLSLCLAGLLLLNVSSCFSAPQTSTGNKRTDENIQFGNQQNKPVSVLDDDVLPGAFPSSETTELEEPKQPTADPEEEEEVVHHTNAQDVDQLNGPPSPSPESEAEKHLHAITQHLTDHHHQIPHHREEMVRDLPPVALASRWRSPSHFYNPHWGRPLSPLFGTTGGEEGSFPVRRRRRSAEHAPHARDDPRKVPQVSLHALRTGHRHKRDVHDIRRFRRDLSDIDLDKLRREVDVVELLAMLAKPPSHHSPGYATVTYAPLAPAPAPPRYAPQPKLFPDYEDEEDEEEEDGVGYLRQSVRQHPPPPSDNVMLPAGGRVWRRSGGVSAGYGLSALPGFKRSAPSFFRENNPPPLQQLQEGDIVSLAAMLGAVDPVHHRVRRVAM